MSPNEPLPLLPPPPSLVAKLKPPFPYSIQARGQAKPYHKLYLKPVKTRRKEKKIKNKTKQNKTKQNKIKREILSMRRKASSKNKVKKKGGKNSAQRPTPRNNNNIFDLRLNELVLMTTKTTTILITNNISFFFIPPSQKSRPMLTSTHASFLFICTVRRLILRKTPPITPSIPLYDASFSDKLPPPPSPAHWNRWPPPTNPKPYALFC